MEKTLFKKRVSRLVVLLSSLFFSYGAIAIEPTEVQLDKLSFDQLQQAAQAGDPDAQYALGYMYYYGKSVPQNTPEALNWIKRASVQGQEQAVKALALIQGQAQPAVTQPPPATVATAEAVLATATTPAVSTPVTATQSQSSTMAVAANAANPVTNPASSTMSVSTSVSTASSAPVTNPQQPVMATTAHTPSAMSSSTPVSQGKTANAMSVPNTQQNATAATMKQPSPAASTPAMATTTSPAQPAVPSKANAVAAVNLTTTSSQSATLANQEQHLLTIPSNYHTLQLIGSFNEQDVLNYIKANGLQGKATYYRGDHQGKDWYVVLYGVYKTLPEAQAAIATLPEPLKKQNPWVRSLSAVQASIKKMSA